MKYNTIQGYDDTRRLTHMTLRHTYIYLHKSEENVKELSTKGCSKICKDFLKYDFRPPQQLEVY